MHWGRLRQGGAGFSQRQDGARLIPAQCSSLVFNAQPDPCSADRQRYGGAFPSFFPSNKMSNIFNFGPRCQMGPHSVCGADFKIDVSPPSLPLYLFTKS